MLKIIKVQPTVGHAEVLAVTIKDENADDVHNKLQDYISSVYGKYTSVQYIAQYQTPVVNLAGYNVVGFIDADALVEISK
jgi:hypothetical protein